MNDRHLDPGRLANAEPYLVRFDEDPFATNGRAVKPRVLYTSKSGSSGAAPWPSARVKRRGRSGTEPGGKAREV